MTSQLIWGCPKEHSKAKMGEIWVTRIALTLFPGLLHFSLFVCLDKIHGSGTVALLLLCIIVNANQSMKKRVGLGMRLGWDCKGFRGF